MRVRSALPHNSEAYRAVSGSVVVRKTLLRGACNSVFPNSFDIRISPMNQFLSF